MDECRRSDIESGTRLHDLCSRYGTDWPVCWMDGDHSKCEWPDYSIDWAVDIKVLRPEATIRLVRLPEGE